MSAEAGFHLSLFFGNIFIYLFLETEEGRERNIDMQEKHRLIASHTHTPTRTKTHYPGVCPDWEVNLRSSTLWYDAQPPEPPQAAISSQSPAGEGPSLSSCGGWQDSVLGGLLD